MKKYILLVFLIGALLVMGGVYFWWLENTKPVGNDASLQRVIITKGSSAETISKKLKEEGVIRNPLAFKIYVQVTDKADKIQAGEFRLANNLDLSQVVNELQKGPTLLWVTIPEGLRREEIVEKIIIGLELESQIATQFRKEFLELTVRDEGYLFPDTYLFPRDVTAGVARARMLEVFKDQVEVKLQNEIAASRFDMNEILTLASIVERETRTAAERPIVAGIYLNRLEDGMPLQADATVQYAMANVACKNKTDCDWWPTPLLGDLEISSPFNTYKIAGIPPSPIANSGLTAIEAIVSPAETNYYYYIHDSDGNIHYAEDLAGHNENVRKYIGN